MQIIDGIPVFGPVDEGAFRQIKNCAVDADFVALMADHHKGYNMPIGGVAAYKNHISPAGVGFDIACGNKAVRLNTHIHAWNQQHREDLADKIFKNISFGVGRVNAEKVEDALFDSPVWDELPIFKEIPDLKDMAVSQLGTVGSGNHYVDVFKDSNGFLWVGCHFGSRGLGHKIATYFLQQMGVNPNGNMDDPPALLEVSSDLGEQYIKAMELAGSYAYAGRSWVCAKVAALMGAEILEEVHNHHNYAWRENHGGEDFWVVRKGATPAFEGQRGFVGGSMGESSVILKGTGGPVAEQYTFCSTVHGAGRVMSRTQAAGKKRWVKGKQVSISEGVVNMEKVRSELTARGIILRGAGADEAPEVYKRLDAVLREHSESIIIEEELHPLIVCMAGANEYDPYKD